MTGDLCKEETGNEESEEGMEGETETLQNETEQWQIHHVWKLDKKSNFYSREQWTYGST